MLNGPLEAVGEGREGAQTEDETWKLRYNRSQQAPNACGCENMADAHLRLNSQRGRFLTYQKPLRRNNGPQSDHAARDQKKRIPAAYPDTTENSSFGSQRQDVVGMARTGSGKTAAFVIPMLERYTVLSTPVHPLR